ncbi:Transglycosylase SLT domain-containing protein [Natronincola peptidivorans]|uniref:Transglycosylase SLT domain-containing protein n=1 Tax=Natronincola peptidivorans TaxID=426128 RepID=A0A1H9ZU05_9FIRM|nr:S-layer homology domain-containing protein [Natronincola peptidivorans]SES85231.1 Transglycosylase SLT domain-containing protein [Natronincola peptidivorans]
MRKRKRVITFLLILTLAISTQLVYSFGSGALSHEEVEKIIEEVAREKGIPSVILKAIAWKESGYRQFNSSGNPLVSGRNTGIMQINQVHRHLDWERVRYDIRYNIEAGADVLLGRWHATGSVYPTIGDMDPNVLEHWYFALWGYNSWLARNNPNVAGEKAYQEGIFQLIRDKYNQPITSIDASYLPSSGLPSSDLWIPTPETHHFGDLNHAIARVFKDLVDHPKQEYIAELYEMGVVSGVGGDRFNPDGYITKEQMAVILRDILELETTEEMTVGEDWQEVSSWAKDAVAAAYQQEILSLNEEGNLEPKGFVTREEAMTILFEGFKREVIYDEDLMVPIAYIDFDEISLSALNSVAYFIGKGVLTVDHQQPFGPKEHITRGELCKLIYMITEKL